MLITINLHKQQFRIYVKLFCSKEDYIKALNGKGGSEQVKQLRRSIQQYCQKAEMILERLPNPTKDLFRRLFKSEAELFTSNQTSLQLLFQMKIDELNSEERFGNARSYRCAMRSLLRFKKDVSLEQVDEAFLKNYKTYIINQGYTITCAQIYLRHLKAIYNKAIKEGYINDRYYPFKNFVIGASEKSQSVLYVDQLEMLWNYKTKNSKEEKAIAFFFFCYLCNGINFKDLPYLRFKNITGNVLSFIRQKTKRTSKTTKEIKVFLSDEVWTIINKWGNKSRSDNDYLFPLVKQYKSALHMDLTINRCKANTNIILKRIGIELGFNENLTLGLARHSFSTRLNEEGVQLKFISDALGHKDMKTTEHYIKSLPDKNLQTLSCKLLPFNQTIEYSLNN